VVPGLELLLKAALLAKDYDTYYRQLRKRGFGHDLVSTAEEVARAFGQHPMRATLRAKLQLLSNGYKDQRWRYGHPGDIFIQRDSLVAPLVQRRTKALLKLLHRSWPKHGDWQW
jgi:hypothetical protein